MQQVYLNFNSYIARDIHSMLLHPKSSECRSKAGEPWDS